ncbi:MAG: hypothetical protein AAGA02_08060 [Bacteroidota bacterium]
MKFIKSIFSLSLLLGLGLFASCSDDDDDDPTPPDDVETITQVVLTFTPAGSSGDVVSATWFDADGDGAGVAPVIDDIELEEGVDYTLAITIANTLVSPAEDITAEILAEANDHQLFFGFTNNIFGDPMGDGNIDNASDPVNYNDQDGNGLPLGLSTAWSAGAHTEDPGEFRVVLKHQPGLKTATSDASIGEVDFDITFALTIEEDPNEEEETITEVVLTFTPTGEGDVVTATWLDADGDGAAMPMIDEVDLIEGEEYTLAITLANTLVSPEEDVTAEILDEDDEHQFFFEFTNNIFGDPMGDGNIDNRDDPLNYNDEDENGLPVGLSTTWTAGAHTETPGQFRVVLKHQPGLKTATSDASDGGSDIDIIFDLNIEEDPNEEEELITEVVLTFTPAGGGDAITATWLDADGDGAGMPTIDDINLMANTEYTMSITLTNTLEDPDEDITAEILEEDDEHMFFFEFTADIFSDPTGDGNVGTDNRNDPVNYNDQDENGNPVGLSTTWTTGSATTSAGNFGVILKHQPGLKSSTSDSTVGGTDVDIDFPININ